jgi:addiction module RelB/DinJ family antitoxin
MNTKTLITIKTDKSLKNAAQNAAQEIGLPLGTLINSFLMQFVRTKEVTLSSEYRPTPALIASIHEAEAEFARGSIPKPVRTARELIKELRS